MKTMVAACTRKVFRGSLPFWIICIGISPAVADEVAQRDFISVLPVYIDTDSSRGTREGYGARFTYGYALAPKWYWETDIYGAILETGNQVAIDFYQTGASTGVSWSLWDRNEERWTPYVLGALGLAYNDALPDEDDGESVALSLGLGAVSKPLLDNGMRLRAEARYIYDTFEDNFGDTHYSFGVEFPLGGRVEEKVVYVERVIERVVEVEKTVEVEKPAEADSDGDSIVDGRDMCPDTLPNVRVDAQGCIIASQTVTLNTVSFQLNSVELTDSSRVALDPVARSLINQPDIVVEVGGHADSVGDASFNQNLSQGRAESVRSFLIEEGVDPGRITAIGYGESRPVADNATAEGRAMNRRVEFRLIK